LSIDIERVPLVEGRYEIGVYIWTDTGSGDFLDLQTLVVGPPSASNRYDRVPAIHRGDVEVEFTVEKVVVK
jgi:hypothetical protein